MSQVCKRCGEWYDECTCGREPLKPPKPTYEEITAENERLLRVVEQATEFAGLGIAGENLYVGSAGQSRSSKYPDLYVHLKREGGNG